CSSMADVEQFLQPLHIDIPKIHSLARAFASTFATLASESEAQFLPTPISDSVLRPEGDEKGRGGTNLRVGFIELLGPSDLSMNGTASSKNGNEDVGSRVQRQLEKSWPIGEILKQNKGEDLFKWIGECVAEVVLDGCRAWPGLTDPLPMGVTFSFPMVQRTLSDATLMGMGKGFAVQSKLDLAELLMTGYERSRLPSLPRIEIVAICNDTVATLVSFAYQLRKNPRRKAAMGLIVGTGCNATIPLALSKLHPSKRPKSVKVLDDREAGDLKITINTEWTIKGAAGPLHDLGFITEWDSILDTEGEAPGFQPFEYMTAGRYLGELGRLIIVDYFTTHLHIPKSSLPSKLLVRHGLTTTFLGNIGLHLSAVEPSLVKQLDTELPPLTTPDSWKWTAEAAETVLAIAKTVQRRAAGLVAAAVIGLLACADELHLNASSSTREKPSGGSKHNLTPVVEELMVGYTGGCIMHFQDYLGDCQDFLDSIIEKEFGEGVAPRVVLLPCHDGGILGAGILAGTVHNVAHDAR
ncbi:Hexokinase I, partial [Hyphodiscus hymeniophilus]